MSGISDAPRSALASRRQSQGKAIARHEPRVALFAALSLALGIACDGFDNAFGNAASFAMNAILLVYLLLIAAPPLAFWGWVAPVAGVMALAAAWLALPLFDGGRQWSAPPLTPDIQVSQFLGLAGAMVALLSGCVVGFRHVRRTMVDWLLLFACMEAVLGLLVWQGDWPLAGDFWSDGREGRFAGTLGNANVAAALFGAFATLALTRALTVNKDRPTKGGMRRRMISGVLHWLALLLMLGACAATASRAAMLLTLGGLLAVSGFTLYRRREYKVLLVIAAACGMVAAVVLTGVADRLFERSHQLSTASTERWAMWSHCIDLVRASPLFGYGSGSFSALNSYALADPRMAGALWSSNSPHDILLRLALDGGLPYLGLILLAALWIGGCCLLVFHHKGWDMLSLGMVTALLVILGCAMVDIALDVPAVITLFVFLVGMLWGRAFSRSDLFPR